MCSAKHNLQQGKGGSVSSHIEGPGWGGAGITREAELASSSQEAGTKAPLEGHLSLQSNQSESSIGSGSPLAASTPGLRANNFDSACDNPQALGFETYLEACIDTLLGPPPEDQELFADLLLPEDSYESLWAST